MEFFADRPNFEDGVEVRLQLDGIQLETTPDCEIFQDYKENLIMFIATEYIHINNDVSKLYFYQPELKKTLSIQYPSISLHAIARVPYPHIYLQLQASHYQMNQMNRQLPLDQEEDGNCLIEMKLRIQNDQENDLERVFEQLSFCSALFPDDEEEETPYEQLTDLQKQFMDACDQDDEEAPLN